MVLFLTLISSVASIAGNIAGKLAAGQTHRSLWLMATLLAYAISTLFYVYALRLGGKFTIVNALFYAIVPIVTIASGLFFFNEKLTTIQTMALVLGLASIVLFTLEDGIVMR